jgi:hypothetical protein
MTEYLKHPDVLPQNMEMFSPKTPGCNTPKHGDVLGEKMGMF